MKNHTIKLIIVLIMVCVAQPLFAISTAVKAQNDYFLTLSLLRQIRIMVENFGDENSKNKYQEIQALFQTASEDYYGQNFDNAQSKIL
jgi:hypothetical protein